MFHEILSFWYYEKNIKYREIGRVQNLKCEFKKSEALVCDQVSPKTMNDQWL